VTGYSGIDQKRTVTPQDWQRAKAVLTVAAELTGPERVRVVEAEFPDEPTLRFELLSMLEAHDRITTALGPTRTAALSNSISAGISEPARPSSDAISVGAQYGPYRVVQALGAGGMGQVFLAQDVRLGRRVALKGLTGRWLRSPTARQRLLREARAAAALSHANIATLYDVLEDDRRGLLVMEYVEGRTAAALLAEGPMPLGHAVRLALQIADAVVYAHDHGIIHCDLKPSNVQVTRDGTAKVLDFGLAHAKYDVYEFDPDSPTSQGMLIGTPPYMPPERLLTGTLNASGDIYSLGVTLFEMVTGRRPFDEPNFAALTGAILGTSAPRPSSLVPGCPARLDAVIARALAKDPKQRYQTARELGLDLRAVLVDIDTGTQPIVGLESPLQTQEPSAGADAPRSSRSLLAAVVVITIVVVLTFAGFVASTFYNSALGRTGGFQEESPLSWPLWGARAMVAPVALMGGVAASFALLTSLCRLALTTLRRVQGRCEPLLVKVRGLSTRYRSASSAMLGPALLLAHIVALLLLLPWFGDLLASLDAFIVQRPPGQIAALAPQNDGEQKLYQMVLSLELFLFSLGWYRLLKRRFVRNERDGFASVIGGITLTALTLFLLVVPYRIFRHNEHERVLYASRPCYLVGERGNEVLLFCPLQPPPWNRIVRVNDPALARTGVVENIFTELSKVR